MTYMMHYRRLEKAWLRESSGARKASEWTSLRAVQQILGPARADGRPDIAIKANQSLQWTHVSSVPLRKRWGRPLRGDHKNWSAVSPPQRRRHHHATISPEAAARTMGGSGDFLAAILVYQKLDENCYLWADEPVVLGKIPLEFRSRERDAPSARRNCKGNTE